MGALVRLQRRCVRVRCVQTRFRTPRQLAASVFSVSSLLPAILIIHQCEGSFSRLGISSELGTPVVGNRPLPMIHLIYFNGLVELHTHNLVFLTSVLQSFFKPLDSQFTLFYFPHRSMRKFINELWTSVEQSHLKSS